MRETPFGQHHEFAEEIEIWLRSRFTVLWILSYVEERIVTSFKELCHMARKEAMVSMPDILSWVIRIRIKSNDAVDVEWMRFAHGN